MSDRDLKLNTFRTTKQSPNLVLEQHDHCEVPAGCGGVVLRWRQRSRIPVAFWIHTLAERSVFLDGQLLEIGRPLIPPGAHVLALRFGRIEKGSPVLMAACLLDEKPPRRDASGAPIAPGFRMPSLPDGSWKYQTRAPADDSWMMPGFDDSAWKPMIARAFPKPAEKDWYASGRMQRIGELGGQGLGIEGAADVLLVRRAFTLEPS